MTFRIHLDKEQRKHLASVFDKAAISFIGVVGYNYFVAHRVLELVLSALLFVAAQAGILWFIKEKNDEAK